MTAVATPLPEPGDAGGRSGDEDGECEFDFGVSETEALGKQTGIWNVGQCSEGGLGWRLIWEVVWVEVVSESRNPARHPGREFGGGGCAGEEAWRHVSVQRPRTLNEPVKETRWSMPRQDSKGVRCPGPGGEDLGGSGWSQVPKAANREEK